jgi:branched-chain amino acid transport system substrate-binding protein
MGVLFQAIEAIHGDVEDTEKLTKAIRSVQMDTIRGPIKIDAWGQVIQNMLVRRMEKVGGVYQNTVLKTYEGVSQFWTWKPEEYMRNPVWSNSYPPCKYCK